MKQSGPVAQVSRPYREAGHSSGGGRGLTSGTAKKRPGLESQAG